MVYRLREWRRPKLNKPLIPSMGIAVCAQASAPCAPNRLQQRPRRPPLFFQQFFAIAVLQDVHSPMMGWFSSLFSPSASSSSSSNSRRTLAMSTHDAFSLPTSSPLTSSHPDAFTRPRSTTPDVEVATPNYAYPPSTSSPTKYDYIPPLT